MQEKGKERGGGTDLAREHRFSCGVTIIAPQAAPNTGNRGKFMRIHTVVVLSVVIITIAPLFWDRCGCGDSISYSQHKEGNIRGS